MHGSIIDGSLPARAARVVMSPVARAARVAVLALALMVAIPVCALGASGTKLVRYHGHEVRVPSAWPVYDLAKDPSVCVRFNRHAVYLGQPGAGQRCPSHAAGRTEALLLEPVSGRVKVIATWGRDPALIEHALGLRSLSAVSALGGLRVASASPLRPRARIATATTPGGIYTGLGFDVCSTPGASQMSAWGSSPYHAVGIYIGGANMACAQPNLSPTWVSNESAAGWSLIPIYVGLQAPGNSCGCAAISPSNASSQGAAAAADAVTQAQALGMGPGNPLYFDMEAYARGATNSSAVLSFLAAWTNQLHADGYKSGVYSSDDSGVSDLASQWGTSYVEPDELWIANWNGAKSTGDPNVPPNEWAAHQRLHQYQGAHNETHGGVTLNIDGDYLDAATAGPGSVSGAASAPSASSPPALSGTALEGQTLSEAHGTWPGTPTAYSFQWEDCNANGISCLAIPGATSQTYTLAPSDVGHTVRVSELASYAGGPGVPSISPATTQVMSLVPFYWLYTAYGNVYPGPGTTWYRSPFSNGYRASTITGMAATSDGKGYWLVGARGGIYPFGDAIRYPSPVHRHPIAGIVSAPGGGYWLYTAYGNVYPSSGTAWYGSPFGSGFRGGSITGMAATTDGRGYWLVSAKGRVFAFGDAMSYPRLWHAHPIRGIVAAPGAGYWLYTSYGNVYTTPGTPWYGSPFADGFRNSSVTGMAATPDGLGYWLATRGGMVFAYGDAAALPPAQPIHPIAGAAAG